MIIMKKNGNMKNEVSDGEEDEVRWWKNKLGKRK